MSIFDERQMSLEELAATDLDAYADIVAEEAKEEYLSGGKVLSLDYYRYFGRPFDKSEWTGKAAAK